MSAPIIIDGYRVEPLTPQAWPAYADLAERHNGVWGRVLVPVVPPTTGPAGARAGRPDAQGEVRARGPHARGSRPEGERAVAWCQFGTVAELANIHHRNEGAKGFTRPPDYRLTCLFVDRDCRRDGVAAVAVRGALELIARAGGGLVEAYPHDLPEGKKVSSSFLYNSTRTMYERLGFSYDRPKGKGNCVMSRVVAAHEG